MFRLFVAIDLPSELKDHLAELAFGLPGTRWHTPDQLHLTLRFIGEMDGGVLLDIIESLHEVRGSEFELRLKGLGHFPLRGTPEQLWVGVEKSEALTQLHGRIESALYRACIPRDTRKFTPHVTIARITQPSVGRIATFLAANNLFQTEPFLVSEFLLYSSTLASEGAIHEIEETYPLG